MIHTGKGAVAEQQNLRQSLLRCEFAKRQYTKIISIRYDADDVIWYNPKIEI